MNNRDLEFLYEIGTLRNMPRGWQQHIQLPTASIAEHMYRVMWLALILARMEKVDENAVLKMALSHDLAETRTFDSSYVQKVYVEANEDQAAADSLAGTSVADFKAEILDEYKKRESPASRIVKDADNLDIDLEMKELEANGFHIPPEWKTFRTMVRNEKLYTESAKKLWDDIQSSDIHSWHVAANKWLKIPDAGT